MLDAELERAMRERFSNAAFARWMGLELGALDEGSSEILLKLEQHHLNPGGIAHGGVIAGLLDAAIGLAQRSLLGMGSTHVTLELHVNYLRPARPGLLVARGTAVHRGKRIGYGEATLFDAKDRVLARGSATFMLVDDPKAAPGSDS
jgi:uncharacterized protein (TIGR00369 family)